jgi:hypothetical protein
MDTDQARRRLLMLEKLERFIDKTKEKYKNSADP